MLGRKGLRESAFYIAVGIANTAAYIVVAYLLSKFAGWPSYLASGSAYVVAVLISFVGNSVLTFEGGDVRSPTQLFKYGQLYAVGLVWNALVIHLFDRAFQAPVLGFFAFAISWTAVGFLVNKYVIFVRR